MDTARFDGPLRSPAPSVSRRGVFAGLTGGLLTMLPLAFGVEEAQAKKRKRPSGKKRKKHKTQNITPSAPSPPALVTRADAMCAGPIQGAYSDADGNVRWAQTFNAVASGQLVSAQLLISHDAVTAGDYLLHLGIVDGAGFPTDGVLASALVAGASIPNGSSTVTFKFENPAAVVGGAPYALVLTRPGSTHLTWGVRGDNPCSGRAFHSPAQTGAFATQGTNTDFIFTIFVSA